MTRRQRTVLLAMQSLEDKGRTATVRGVCLEAGGGVGSIYSHINKLVSLGYVAWDGKTRRYWVTRRVEPIVHYQVWDDRTKSLKDFAV